MVRKTRRRISIENVTRKDQAGPALWRTRIHQAVGGAVRAFAAAKAEGAAQKIGTQGTGPILAGELEALNLSAKMFSRDI